MFRNYARYNEATGKITGLFSPELFDVIPEPSIALSDDDWQKYLKDQDCYTVKDNQLVYTPRTEPTKEEMQKRDISTLDAEYQPQFDALSIAWATASMDGNTALAANIKADKLELQNEYNAKREAITNG